MRRQNEAAHGRRLAEGDPEDIWGWSSPAGRIRALRRAQLIATGAALGPGVHALEPGCGTGLFTKFFVATGASIVAIDLSQELLSLARSRVPPAERVEFVARPLEDYNPEKPFDAVIGSSLLHHLDIGQALAHIFRLLRPGGVMSFAEPNMLNPQIAVQKNIRWIKKRLGDSPDETAFIRWRFQRLLLNAGFSDTEIVPFDWLHPATPVTLVKPVSRIGAALERIPVVREFAGSLYIRARRPLR